jgi:hypothetical protein
LLPFRNFHMWAGPAHHGDHKRRARDAHARPRHVQASKAWNGLKLRSARRNASDKQESSEPLLSSEVEQAQKTASAATNRVKKRARDFAEQQKSTGADQIGGVAHAMEAAAGELKRQMPKAAEYIEEVAGRFDTMASTLRQRSVDDILDSATAFARKQPILFFAGAVATGFALSRFAKSSANRGS